MIMICFPLYFLLNAAAYIMLMSPHNTITDILSIYDTIIGLAVYSYFYKVRSIDYGLAHYFTHTRPGTIFIEPLQVLNINVWAGWVLCTTEKSLIYERNSVSKQTIVVVSHSCIEAECFSHCYIVGINCSKQDLVVSSGKIEWCWSLPECWLIS